MPTGMDQPNGERCRTCGGSGISGYLQTDEDGGAYVIEETCTSCIGGFGRAPAPPRRDPNAPKPIDAALARMEIEYQLLKEKKNGK